MEYAAIGPSGAARGKLQNELSYLTQNQVDLIFLQTCKERERQDDSRYGRTRLNRETNDRRSSTKSRRTPGKDVEMLGDVKSKKSRNQSQTTRSFDR